MQLFSSFLTWLGIIIAFLFIAVVFLTGKGDAMSGGGGVRTSFKGKASFDDIMSKVTIGIGIGFMALMLILDVMGNYTIKK